MTAASKQTRGFIKTTVALVAIVLLAVCGFVFFDWGRSEEQVSENDLTFVAVSKNFVSSIVESGDVASSSNVDIRCKVRERGGTAILKIVEEGTRVEEGDFLCQLEDSNFRDEVVERKIRVATDRASVIQSQSNLDAAQRALAEFENGQFAQELATYEAEYFIGKENLDRAKEYRKFSENLARKGYITKAQYSADQFAVKRAEKELLLAKSKLEVFRDFSRDKLQAELKAKIAQEEANLEASEFTLELSKQRLKYYEDQVAACYITAPSSGQVVYANEIDGRGESGIVIEEGVTLREGQTIIKLPNPERMQVATKVNDSKINSVRAGQTALIRLDTAPEVPIKGIVRKVANFPLPRRWSQAPIEYEIFVDVAEKNPMVRSGLRAKVEVFIEQIDDAIQVPVSCLVERNGGFNVVVKNNNQPEMRPVEIGPNNESMVIIKSGLAEGEQVLVDPDRFRTETPVTDQGDDT